MSLNSIKMKKTTIKEFYEYYPKKFWCFKKTYKHFKILMKVLIYLEFY